MSLYLGNTPVAGTGYDKADTDLSNLTSQGQNIANWSSNVTNCITEIPQDIKLELNNGTLTLKSGSKVYVPNGAGVFDTITVPQDWNWTLNSLNVVVFCDGNGAQDVLLRDFCFSGSSAPTSFQDGLYALWYDTTNNVVKKTNNGGATWISGYGLPVYTANVDNSYQVFNGFGYIGSTVFALPGVKGLIPNGRNADGSLKNISFEISSIITSTLSYGEGEYYLGYIYGGYIGFLRETITHYLKDENLILDDITGIKHNDWMFFGSFYANSSNKITSFTPKTTFHALDYNDSSTISGWAMPSSRYIDLTVGASGTTYTAPANGWFAGWSSQSGGNFNYVAFMTGSVGNGYASEAIVPSGFQCPTLLPVKKGQVITVLYSQGVAMFRFYYAEGEN